MFLHGKHLPVFGKAFPFPKCSHEAAGVEFIPAKGKGVVCGCGGAFHLEGDFYGR